MISVRRFERKEKLSKISQAIDLSTKIVSVTPNSLSSHHICDEIQINSTQFNNIVAVGNWFNAIKIIITGGLFVFNIINYARNPSKKNLGILFSKNNLIGSIVCILTILMFIFTQPHVVISLTLVTVMTGLIFKIYESCTQPSLDNKIDIALAMLTTGLLIGILCYAPATFLFCMLILSISVFEIIKTAINIYNKNKQTKTTYNILINNNSTRNIIINLSNADEYDRINDKIVEMDESIRLVYYESSENDEKSIDIEDKIDFKI